MLHVNILSGTILKFIKAHTYGTDPVHLESTKFKDLVLSCSECWDEKNETKQKTVSFENENVVLHMKYPGLTIRSESF